MQRREVGAFDTEQAVARDVLREGHKWDVQLTERRRTGHFADLPPMLAVGRREDPAWTGRGALRDPEVLGEEPLRPSG